MEELHQPVLLSAVLQTLAPRVGESYLDLTAGYGGHAKAILDVTRNYKDATLVDRDENAIKYLKEKFAQTPVELVQKDFYNAALQKIECGKKYDMILADLGVSSPQLDRPERGFTFKTAGPIDMRMDPRQTLTAATIVNHGQKQRLVELFVEYGEVKRNWAGKVAQIIVQGRPWQDTQQLAEAIARAAGARQTKKSAQRHGQEHGRSAGARRRIHPATQIFQALRIEVNDELGEIERTLPLMTRLLKPGGRMAVISFHSLEDRIVKNYLRAQSERGEESELEILTKKPIVAENMELVINPRARSAKLRAAKRRI